MDLIDVMVKTMAMMVVDFDQRPTKGLPEAITDLDGLYLETMHEYGEFIVSSITSWTMTESFSTGEDGRALLDFMRGRDGETERGEVDFGFKFVVISWDGWDWMTETEMVDRRDV